MILTLFILGALVLSGTKYAMRTNIMFENVQNFSEKSFDEDEEYKEMKQIFQSFDKLSFEGDVHKFTSGKELFKIILILFFLKLFYVHNKFS